MRYFFFLIFLHVTYSFSQENNPVYRYDFSFKQNTKQVLFGDNVNLRSGPSTDDEVISVLRIGTPILINRKSKKNITIRGNNWSWYQVKVGDKLGYISGAFIALREEKMAGNRFLISIKSNAEEAMTACVRELISDTVFAEYFQEIPVWAFGIKVTNGRGIDGVENILLIDYYAYACGQDGGGAYFFHDGNQLIKAAEYAEVGDGGVFWFDEQFIFPEDEKGQEGIIIYRKEHGESLEEEPYWEETHITIKHLKWTGSVFSPSIEEI